MLLLAILCLACWLVSIVTICAFILIITSLGFFPMTYFHFWWFKILLGSLIRWSFGMFHRKIPGGEILSCTLWEHYYAQFLSYLNERGDDGPMVVILTHARIKDAHGSYLASVTNSFKASKLLINDPILEIQEFKERTLFVLPWGLLAK
ncbi:hypothetical protein GmHk_15G044898 [Glycine max]|nr:hypothetical protein GmHk_15G044898 [Glycine max]